MKRVRIGCFEDPYGGVSRLTLPEDDHVVPSDAALLRQCARQFRDLRDLALDGLASGFVVHAISQDAMEALTRAGFGSDDD
ncbi:hypothetical protein [Desulfobaculum sp.]